MKKQRNEERNQTTKAVKKQQSSIEKSTLGDLDVFSQLKDQLSQEDDKGE